jgi:hypothetical protein
MVTESFNWKKNGIVYIWVVDCGKGGSEVEGEECGIETGKTN